MVPSLLITEHFKFKSPQLCPHPDINTTSREKVGGRVTSRGKAKIQNAKGTNRVAASLLVLWAVRAHYALVTGLEFSPQKEWE